VIDFRLYLVTDRRACAPRALGEVVREACGAGVRAVQLREKDLDPASVHALAAELSGVTHETGATLFINQAHAVAGAPALHYPESIPIPRDFRDQHPNMPVGASTHSISSARDAARRGADFVTFGPVYETPAKVKYGPPQGLARLSEVSAALAIPVFAIGGVTPERASLCMEAGAAGVAVMGAIMGATNVGAVVRAFEKALGGL
jgi:thiamine-phosphate pyrophosphorylase